MTLSACGLFKSSKKEDSDAKPKADPPKLVGRIASIPADKRFVLIQSYGKWNIDTGTILTTRGTDQRSANLLVTGESLGQFAAADLQSGTPEVGDAVYSHHTPKPEATSQESPATTPDTPSAPKLPENHAVPPL